MHIRQQGGPHPRDLTQESRIVATASKLNHSATADKGLQTTVMTSSRKGVAPNTQPVQQREEWQVVAMRIKQQRRPHPFILYTRLKGGCSYKGRHQQEGGRSLLQTLQQIKGEAAPKCPPMKSQSPTDPTAATIMEEDGAGWLLTGKKRPLPQKIQRGRRLERELSARTSEW